MSIAMAPFARLVFVICLLLITLCSGHAVRPEKRTYSLLPSASLSAIASLSDPAVYLDTSNPTSLLSRILIPRPPDTENSLKVRETILNIFRTQLPSWHNDQHVFTTDTPEGKKKMTNLILTKNPSAPRKLVIAAHYDSKYFSPSSGMQAFVGATDSAAPCAFMVDLAVALDKLMDEREAKVKGEEKVTVAQETTLQLVFFDGEEAYHQWTDSDSIYGSKALAELWSNTYWSLNSTSITKRRYRTSYGPIEHMNTIEHLILLDLLGAPNPSVPSYYDSTSWLHSAFADAEQRLREGGLLWPRGDERKGKSFFSKNRPWGGIEDDHLPFIRRGVPILHVIPSPFPAVWHKLGDDKAALDWGTMYAWCMILRVAVAEYLGLEPRGVGRRGEGGGDKGFRLIVNETAVD